MVAQGPLQPKVFKQIWDGERHDPKGLPSPGVPRASLQATLRTSPKLSVLEIVLEWIQDLVQVLTMVTHPVTPTLLQGPAPPMIK